MLVLCEDSAKKGFYHNVSFLIPKIGEHRDGVQQDATHSIIANCGDSIVFPPTQPPDRLITFVISQ